MQIKLGAWRPRARACMPRQVMTCMWPGPKDRIAMFRVDAYALAQPHLAGSLTSAPCCYAKIESATQSRNQLGLSITDLTARQFDDSAIPAPLLASQDSGSFRKIEFGLICRTHADRGSLRLWSSLLCLILLHIRNVQSMTSQFIHVKPFFPLHEASTHAQLACIRDIYKEG
jgi:hypothetical protein